MATNKEPNVRLLGHNIPDGVKNTGEKEQDTEQNIQPKVTTTLFIWFSLQENCERRDKECDDNQDNVRDSTVVTSSLSAHLEGRI
jgi:hypothetical protein